MIADIASADDRSRIVGDHQFVVHPVIQTPLVEQHLGAPQGFNVSAIGERIEYADLDAGIRRQGKNFFVAGGGVTVVDQHAYANAAIDGAQQR